MTAGVDVGGNTRGGAGGVDRGHEGTQFVARRKRVRRRTGTIGNREAIAGGKCCRGGQCPSGPRIFQRGRREINRTTGIGNRDGLAISKTVAAVKLPALPRRVVAEAPAV